MLQPSTSPERYSLAVFTDNDEIYPEIRKQLGGELRVSLAGNETEIKEALERVDLHAILFDLDCIGDGPTDGLDVLEEIRKIREDVVLVALTRNNGRTIPLKASQAGADDFFLVPLNYEELKMVVFRAIEKRALELEGRRLVLQAESRASFCGLVGASPAMQKVYESIEAVARTDASIVLRGESGVGKELVAQAIVRCSDRPDQPFIAVNCSALPDTLMESELFGYTKGAFTGANENRRGLFQASHGGTLFMDEIGNMNLAMQVKLYRALQEGKVRPLGSTEEIDIDVRVGSRQNLALDRHVGRHRLCLGDGVVLADLVFKLVNGREPAHPERDRVRKSGRGAHAQHVFSNRAVFRDLELDLKTIARLRIRHEIARRRDARAVEQHLLRILQ